MTRAKKKSTKKTSFKRVVAMRAIKRESEPKPEQEPKPKPKQEPIDLQKCI